MRKFRGHFEKLQELVATTGISGEWVESKQQIQYRTDSGAILNYWESTGTVNFQGLPDSAKELEAAMFPASSGRTRACRVQPNTRRTAIHDAGLQALTRSIIRNRVGPIFDHESAFIAKVAEQCMLDIWEHLDLSTKPKESVGTSPRYVNHRSAGRR
jgi:hypothetical protein